MSSPFPSLGSLNAAKLALEEAAMHLANWEEQAAKEARGEGLAEGRASGHMASIRTRLYEMFQRSLAFENLDAKRDSREMAIAIAGVSIRIGVIAELDGTITFEVDHSLKNFLYVLSAYDTAAAKYALELRDAFAQKDEGRVQELLREIAAFVHRESFTHGEVHAYGKHADGLAGS